MLSYGSRGPQAIVENLESRRLLSLTPFLVEVPISAAAKAADPALNDYRTFDLRVTSTDASGWVSGDLKVDLSSGHFYVPGGELDADYAQKSLWAGHPNLQFDTFVCSPNFNIPLILGASFLTQHTGGTFTATAIDLSWGAITGGPIGTFTVARLTVSSDAAGSAVGRVGDINDPATPIYFGSVLPSPTAQGMISGRIYWANANQGPAGLKGTAYIDQNNNNMLDAGEPTAATLGGTGQFIFTNVLAGTYTVRQQPVGAFHVSNLLSGAYTVTLNSDTARADGLNFANSNPGATNLYVTSFEDVNGNGVYDLGTEGVVTGATTYFDNNDNGMLDAGEAAQVATQNGTVVFQGVPITAYKIRQIAPAGFQLTSPASGVVRVTPTGNLNSVEFGYRSITGASPASIAGYVYNDLNGDGYRQANERIIAGVSVYLQITNDDGSITELPATTDSYGWYRFDNLAAGMYHVRQVLPDGYVLSPGFALVQKVFTQSGSSELCFWGVHRDLRRVFSIAPAVGIDPRPDRDMTDGALIDSLL